MFLIKRKKGLFNAVLFAVLLGREKKTVEQTVTSILTDEEGDADAFHTDGQTKQVIFPSLTVVAEVRLRVFGESIVWYFVE